MGYLDLLSRSGLRVSIQPTGKLRLVPDEIITDDIRQVMKAHAEGIIAEIKEAANHTDPTSSEIAPDYHFLWVATTLESFEEYDPRYGYEIGRDPVYRMLDAPYYAWLRHRMENASKAHQDGRMDDQQFSVLRDRFNVIHNWAVSHIGEDALRRAIRTTNIKRYIPPSEMTVKAYHQTWVQAKAANELRICEKPISQATNPDVSTLRQLLATQGYALISTSIADDHVLILRDETISLPGKHASKVAFTIDECTHMLGSEPDAVQRIYEVKRIMGGRVVSTETLTIPSEATEPEQQSLFAMPNQPSEIIVSTDSKSKVDAIRDQALSLGWTEDGLYRTQGSCRFPFGQDYGLVCFLGANCTIGEVTDKSIEIIKTHKDRDGQIKRVSTMHYNPAVKQPWMREVDMAGMAS